MQQILPSLAELTAHAQQEPTFAAWQAGYGPVQHSAQTQAAVFRLAHQLVQSGQQPSLAQVYQLLQALDRLSVAGLWLVVHMTYARRVRLDGAPMQVEDFKAQGTAEPPFDKFRPGCQCRPLGGSAKRCGGSHIYLQFFFFFHRRSARTPSSFMPR